MAFDHTVTDDSIDVETTETAAPEQDVETEEAQAEPTQATDDDVEGQEVDEQPSAEPKPKNRASDRIQQLVAEKKELEARLNQQSQAPEQANQSSNDGAPVKPNIDDFDLENGLDDYFAAQAEYDEKLSDWKLDQRLQQREQSRQQEAKNAEITDTFNARFKANPEFKENFQQLATLMQDKPITADPSELYAGDDLMDLLEHVAADQDLYYELAEMSEKKQYAEFGRIHAQIQAEKGGQSKAVRQSKAPKPPNHTNANAPMKRDPYKGSDDDVMRSRGL